MALLEYENQMFLEGFHNDGLFIMARGLGVDRLFLSFIRVYSDPGSLVLVLNTSSRDEEYFVHQLEAQGIQPLPKIITNEFSATDRQQMYLEGGVQFVTSRILVVDLLTDRVPVDKVTGILVYKAHKVIESCQEAFILRLYREKNQTGFIKAFSDNPEAFTSGFCHVERVMKNIFVKKLFLWPRFHANVVSCLDKHKVDVVELHLQLTSSMTNCQTALLDLINACIKELKRCTPAVDMEEVTVESALGRDFDRMVRLQLDPMWHQLSGKTRQLVSDLKTLRLVLRYLTQYDCVTFYNLVNSIRTSEKEFGRNTGWLFLDAADSLFVNAQEQLHGRKDIRNKDKDKAVAGETSKKSDSQASALQLEEPPKWQALKEVLKEIDLEIQQISATAGDSIAEKCRVLVCAEDDRTCNQLREFLCRGAQNVLSQLYKKYIAIKSGRLANKKETDQEEKRQRRKRKVPDATTTGLELTLTQMARNVMSKNKMEDKQDMSESGEEQSDEELLPSDPENTAEEEEEEIAKREEAAEGATLSSEDACYGLVSGPVTILHPLCGCSDPHGLTQTLLEIQPTYVVLYDPDIQFVRQLEVYQASYPSRQLRVYFLLYTGSVEEQRYLTILRREKEAFEFLIREKSTMVIPEERDGKQEGDPNLERGSTSTSDSTNSRKGGLPSRPEEQKIIVDMREFRSELPALIHRRGITVEPVTPNKRKEVSKLFSSLAASHPNHRVEWTAGLLVSTHNGQTLGENLSGVLRQDDAVI